MKEPESYFTPESSGTGEILEKKSRFIGELHPASDIDRVNTQQVKEFYCPFTCFFATDVAIFGIKSVTLHRSNKPNLNIVQSNLIQPYENCRINRSGNVRREWSEHFQRCWWYVG